MGAKEAGRPFLEKIAEYLLSLPFDLKILQEAVTDPDLDRSVRELAAGAIIHTLLPQEGDPGPVRFVDDVLIVRATLRQVVADGSDGAKAFADRFADVYGNLDEDLQLFSDALGDLWPWLTAKLSSFPKLAWKGKKAPQCVDDEEAASFLYEEGLEFQTNYNVTEEQVRNKLRRGDQIVEVLTKRRNEELKKKTG
jgi:hypothetical protein